MEIKLLEHQTRHTMKLSTKTIATLATAVTLSAASVNAFASIGRTAKPFGLQGLTTTAKITRQVAYNPSIVSSLSAVDSSAKTEIEKLRAMAAKLRQEASELEGQQASERSQAVEKEFDKFDTNKDGELSLEELKAALEKTFKLNVPEDKLQRLMDDFDTSGDGKLQKDEYVSIGLFRNRLDSIAYEERQQELDAQKEAQKEAEVAQLMELVNDKEPSSRDKIVSVLPYLFPLMDGISFGKFLLEGNESNPLVATLALMYTLYKSVPLGGFLAFFALSTLSSDLSTNRLVRFNMQQAILLDIALFFPGLLATLVTAASPGLGLTIPPMIGELSSDAVFVALVVTLGYAAVSSLLGVTPDKIPFISDSVSNRVPTADMIQFIDPTTGEPFFKNDNKNPGDGDDEKNKSQ